MPAKGGRLVRSSAALAWSAPAHHILPTRAPRITACTDGPDPEEWRAFRAKLISGGLRITGDEDGGGGITEPEAAPERAPSVAPKNEELLKEQNPEMWREYLDGAWAYREMIEKQESRSPIDGFLIICLHCIISLFKTFLQGEGD